MKYKLLLIAWALLWTPIALAADRVEIVISGLDKTLRENVLAHLGIARLQQSGFIPFTQGEADRSAGAVTETNIRRLHRQATREIQDALQPFGYYRNNFV